MTYSSHQRRRAGNLAPTAEAPGVDTAVTEYPGFRAGDEVLGGTYKILHKDGKELPRHPVETVDQGGAGTVYRVAYRGAQDRALKLLTATSRREDPQKSTADYTATFAKEQKILLRLS